MSNFGQIPSSGNISPKNTNRSSNAEIVKIIRLPEALENNARAVKVEGTVTQSNNNGSVRIQTERGAIDVQFSNNSGDRNTSEPPRTGQRLEVNIPAGRPPRQASIESTPQQTTTPNTHQNIPRSTARTPPQAGQQASNTSPPQRIPSTPIPPQNVSQTGSASGQQTTTQPPSFPPTPLVEGSNVRLVALQPNQALQVSQQSLPTLTTQNTTVNQTAFTANLIAQNAISQLSQSVLSIGVLAQSTTVPLQNIGQALLPPITSNIIQPTQNSILFQNIEPNTSALRSAASGTTLLPTNQANTPFLLQNIGLSPTISATPNLAMSTTQNLITTFQPNATLAPTPPSLNVSSNNTVGKIDVQVLSITPNAVTLVTPKGQTTIPALTQFAPTLTSNNTATTLTGQVTGLTPQGQPLVTLQLPGTVLPQSFILQYTPNNITIGSQIQISIQNLGLTPTQSSITAQSPALTSMLQGFQWSAFDDIVQTLIQNSPQATNSLIRSIPNAGNPAQLGAVGAAVMAAVKSGDLSAWLGDKKIETLQRLGKSGSLSRLIQDTAPHRAEAASNSDWRAVPLPMFWEGEIHKITLFMRQENQQKSKENNEEGSTRFILDLDLSRMGDVQLDGLLRGNRLDLIVRTQSGFSEPMQQMMRGAYSNAIKQAGMNGDVSFQGHTKHWVHVLQENEKLGVSV